MNPGTPTVFVVDDDASFLTSVSRLLRASRFAVRAFPSAEEFLSHLPADAAGCVVADLQMPGMNGSELQKALARTGNSLPLVFLTGHGEIPDSVCAMRQGAEDFLTKRRCSTPLGALCVATLGSVVSARGFAGCAPALTRSASGNAKYCNMSFVAN